MNTARFTAKDKSIVVDLPLQERRFLLQVIDLLKDVGATEGDPAEERLMVPVYLDNPEANEEWWRLMGSELEASRRTDRDVYQRVLNHDNPITLSDGEADAFMRVLNEGRLAFAARLGLEVEDDHDRLPAEEMQALDFLGWVLEDLTTALSKSL